MKETKFRAWDGKRMIQVTEICWRTISQGEEIFHIRGTCKLHGINEYPIGGHADFMDISKITLIQYTGLNDKNGKEIYEGDILKIVDWEDTNIPKPTTWEKGEVRFDNGAFRIHGYLVCEAADHCYCIGNIFKNPELKEI